jgi:hypothetical protein
MGRGVDFSFLEKLQNLRAVNLAGCPVAPRQLVHLARTRIESLNLSRTSIGDGEVHHLNCMPGLHVSACFALLSLGSMIERVRACQTLWLDRCERLSPAGVAILDLPSLRILHIRHCHLFSGGGALRPWRFPELRHLDLRENRNMTGNVLHQCVRGLSELRTVCLDRCIRLDGAAIAALRHLPLLHTLSLIDCPMVSADIRRILVGAEAVRAALPPAAAAAATPVTRNASRVVTLPSAPPRAPTARRSPRRSATEAGTQPAPEQRRSKRLRLRQSTAAEAFPAGAYDAPSEGPPVS